jgi:hypothetical protein
MLRWIFLYQPVEGGPFQEQPGDEARDGGGGVGTAPPGPSTPRAAPARTRVPVREPELALAGARSAPRNLSFNDPSAAPAAFAKAERKEAHGGDGDVQTVRREGPKVGRNDACPCGSGKKFKKCHGQS